MSNFIGKWAFDSAAIGFDDNGEWKFGNAEEYLAGAEDDEDEIMARKQTINNLLELCEGGEIKAIMPIPEDVSKEELDEAVASGSVTIEDGKLCVIQESTSWKEEDGMLKICADGNWFDALTPDGRLAMLTTIYKKVD